MDTIELASLLAEPDRVSDLQNISPLWRGRVLTESGEYIPVWIKRIPAHQLLAECVCSLVGRAISLPIPRPFLVDDPANFLGQDLNGVPLFAMEDAVHPSVRQWIQEYNDPAVNEAIFRWSKLRECVLFDEWSVNIDRNQGNLLYDGENSFVMIDHAFTFGFNQSPQNMPDPKQIFQNMIAGLLLQNSPDLEPNRLAKLCDEIQQKWAMPLIETFEDRTFASSYGMADNAIAIKEFLAERLPLLRSLIGIRTGRPVLEFI